jgi:hypothetical protein
VSQPRPPRRKPAEAASPNLKKQLWIVFGVAILVSALAVALMNLDFLRSIPPEQVIRVYRVHGCRCVFPWARALEAEGFIVRLSETETLKNTRTRLQVPESLHGCHLGDYLGYFVEGHVDASALRALAAQRPDGLGVVTEAVVGMEKEYSVSVLDERSPVLLVDRSGRTRKWFQPAGDSRGGSP